MSYSPHVGFDTLPLVIPCLGISSLSFDLHSHLCSPLRLIVYSWPLGLLFFPSRRKNYLGEEIGSSSFKKNSLSFCFPFVEIFLIHSGYKFFVKYTCITKNFSQSVVSCLFIFIKGSLIRNVQFWESLFYQIEKIYVINVFRNLPGTLYFWLLLIFLSNVL